MDRYISLAQGVVLKTPQPGQALSYLLTDASTKRIRFQSLGHVILYNCFWMETYECMHQVTYYTAHEGGLMPRTILEKY